MLESGWQANYNSGIDRGLMSKSQRRFGKDLIQKGMHEYWGCSGTGANICYMLFQNSEGRMLEIAIVGGMEPDASSPVHSWRYIQELPRVP